MSSTIASKPGRQRKTILQWWTERLNEMVGYQAEARQLYAQTGQANPADYWAILKLAFQGNYADMYTSIVKTKIGKAVYLETNAGSGLNVIQDVNNAIIFGSPLIAARKPRKKFDKYIFIEQNPKYCKALQKLIPEATVINGDANSDVNNPTGTERGLRHALSLVPKNTPILAFVDPYGMDIRWRTVEMLLRTWSDVIINFQRVLRVVGSVARNDKYAETLTDFFGTEQWRKCKTDKDFLNLYMTQLMQYKDLVFPVRIQGRHGYHYYLIVAVKKTQGEQGWISFIERTKEIVENTDADDVEKFTDIFTNRQKTLLDCM